MATVTVEYYGMTGTGKNVTEAKRDAGRQVEAALKGSYTPEIFTHRGTAILLYREPDGWKARIIVDPQRGAIAGPVHGNSYSGDDDLNAIRQYVNEWLADITREATDTEPPAFLKGGERIREWHRKQEFLRRYQEGRERGMNDHEAHSYAGRNPARRDLWEAQEKAAVA